MSSPWIRRASVLVVATASVLLACVSDDPGRITRPVTCDDYCTVIAQTCGGPNAQYRDTDECKRVCGMLNLGTEDDGDVNSIGCRIRIARGAANLEQCTQAGPFGGGKCGARCNTFCSLIEKGCLGPDITPKAPYENSAGTCNEVCPSLKFSATEGEGPNQENAFPGRDTLNCREHHLILALKDKNPHCSHSDGPVSSICTRPDQ